MITGLLVFTTLLLALWAGTHLSHDPGYVMVYFNNWSLETTLFAAGTAIIVLFFLLYYGVRIFTWICHIPHFWRRWHSRKQIRKAQQKTRTGLIEFTEGHWAQARKHLMQGLPHIETPLLNYLTAARAAQEMGDSRQRDEYLREAQQSMPEAKVAVELTQAQLQLAQGQWEQALATLQHLQDLAPHHPYVLKLLMQLYQEIDDWQQLKALLPELKKYQVLSDTDFTTLQKQTYLETLKRLVDLEQADAVKALINELPKPLRQDPDILACYTNFWIQKGEDKAAESVLRAALKKHVDNKLFIVYGTLDESVVHLKFIESLLNTHGHSATLYLVLGQLSEKLQLWGKAKVYYEDSIEREPSVLAYAALAKLLEYLEDHETAATCYKAGLALASEL